MIVTSMQLTISSRRDIAVLQKESSALEGEEDVNAYTLSLPVHKPHINGIKRPTRMVNLSEKPVSPHRECGGSWSPIQWRAADIHEVERRPGS